LYVGNPVCQIATRVDLIAFQVMTPQEYQGKPSVRGFFNTQRSDESALLATFTKETVLQSCSYLKASYIKSSAIAT
jgi:hypothetical protein